MNQGIHEMILPWCGYIPLWSVLSWYSLYLYYSVPTSQQQFRDDKLWTRYCIKSNTNVRAKSIRLDWIHFNTSSTHFPILLYIILWQRSYTSHNLSGSNRGLGATKKSNCFNATNPTSTYVQRVLDCIEFFLIPHRLISHFTLYHTTATILYITQPLWFQQRSRCYKKVHLFKCNKSNINVRTKSIRLDWILFNTSSPHFPFLLYIS